MTKKVERFLIFWLLISGIASVGYAQKTDPLSQMEHKVRRALVTLPYYSVFDNLEFRVEGRKVILSGQVTRPTLKNDAGNVVEKLEEVDSVENNIEVLPLSPMDDEIRLAVYRAIYYHPDFTRYAIQAVPPIHIIVKNGHVMLVGVVSSEADKNFAYVRASQVPGAFSVKNELRTERP